MERSTEKGRGKQVSGDRDRYDVGHTGTMVNSSINNIIATKDSTEDSKEDSTRFNRKPRC